MTPLGYGTQALLPSPTASAAHAINLASRDDLVVAAVDNQTPPRMCYATQAALDLWGLDWDTLVEKQWSDLVVPEEDAPEVMKFPRRTREI
jgi:hypothetical protein